MKLDIVVESISYLFQLVIYRIRSFRASSDIYPIYTSGGVMEQRRALIV